MTTTATNFTASDDNYASDIPYQAAFDAHRGTSFVPETRAESEIRDYAARLHADHEALAAEASSPEQQALLADEFARYRQGYRQRYLAYLHSRSNIVSTMIAGPSNFPAAQMNKRGDTAHRRLTELLEFRTKAVESIRKKLHPERGPIKSTDSDATERLEDKIHEAERRQEAMKAANKIARDKKLTDAQKLEKIVALGLSERLAREALKPEDYSGKTGFPSWMLQNNNANIRRMKKRIEQIETTRETPDSSLAGEHATIEDAASENRIRLFFPGKPDAETRSRLKSSGFRWTPSLGCWQAYRNQWAMEIAKTIAGVAAVPEQIA